MNDEIVVIYMREFRKNLKSNKIGNGKKRIYHDCVLVVWTVTVVPSVLVKVRVLFSFIKYTSPAVPVSK